MAKRIIIGGGTGLVGTALTAVLLEKGYEVCILTRNKKTAAQKSNKAGVVFAEWNVDKQTIDADAFTNAVAIVNLAGAGVVDKPWTDEYKSLIISSRVNSGKTIIKALAENANTISVVINASAIGYYGADQQGHPAFVEADKADANFLGMACRLWEESILPVENTGRRLVIFRTGIVLSTKGGALKEFLKPLAFRMAAVLGNGKQVVSWIHIADLCNMMLYAIENNAVSGVYNAVAPKPVTNKVLTKTLAMVMYGKAFITSYVPAFVLKIMMGTRSIEVLKSTTVSSEKIEGAGYYFAFNDIEKATKNLLAK